MTRRLLPLGIQPFREIIERDCYYVDKTEFALGLDITPEDSSNVGRLDMAVRFNDQIYLFEFKVVELAPDGGALAQIRQRGYADKYRAEGQPIHLIGVEFSRERRSFVAFDVESLPC